MDVNHWLFRTALVIFSIFAIGTNILLLLVFIRKRSLRTIPNRFIINLLVTNLVSNLTVLPVLLPFAELVPHHVILMMNFIGTVSILSILLIGINQYFGVVHSLHYHTYLTHCRYMVSIGCVWLIALMMALLALFFTTNLWYSIGFFIVVIIVPFLLICGIYIAIYRAAHGNSARIRSNYEAVVVPVCGGLRNKIHSAPDLLIVTQQQQQQHHHHHHIDGVHQQPHKHCISTTNLLAHLKHRWHHHRTVFRYYEEMRAARISTLIIFLVLICYVPFGCVVLCQNLVNNAADRVLLDLCALGLMVLSATISPYLFVFRHKRVKREVGRILGFLPKRTRPGPISIVVDSGGVMAPPQVIVTTADGDGDGNAIIPNGASTALLYEKCDFLNGAATTIQLGAESCCSDTTSRGSFSSASTQTSTEEYIEQ